MTCAGSTKAIVQILPPNWEEITLENPPVEVDIFERAPRWVLRYSYEFNIGDGWEGYEYYAEVWGESSEVSVRFEAFEGGFRVWAKGRILQSDGLLGEIQEVLAENQEGGNRIARNFQLGIKNEGINRAWKLVASDSSGANVSRWYQQEPTYKIICGCKPDECEIPCSRKPEGFCCLSKSKVSFLRRKLDEDKKWYEKELW